MSLLDRLLELPILSPNQRESDNTSPLGSPGRCQTCLHRGSKTQRGKLGKQPELYVGHRCQLGKAWEWQHQPLNSNLGG